MIDVLISETRLVFLKKTHSGTTGFPWFYAVERQDPSAHIKETLSWQALEDDTLTVSLTVTQTQPQRFIKEKHVKSHTKTKNVLPETSALRTRAL